MSYATPSLQRKLNLVFTKQKEISIQAFGKIDSRDTLDKVDLVILSTDKKEIPISCFVKDICTLITSQNLSFPKRKYAHLKNINLADSNTDNKNLNIDILIGADFYWDILLDGFVCGNSGPVAINTKVGCDLTGPLTNSCNENKNNCVMLTHVMKVQAEIISENDSIVNDFSKVWSEENNLKNYPYEKDDYFDNEFNFKEYINESITVDQLKNRYEVEFPFKSDHGLFGDNYSNCQKRMKNLSKKFQKTKLY